MARTTNRTAAGRRHCVFSSGFLADVLDWCGVPSEIVPVRCSVRWPNGSVTPFPTAARQGWAGHCVLVVQHSGLVLVDSASEQLGPDAPLDVVAPIPHPLSDGPVTVRAGAFVVQYHDGTHYGGREHYLNDNHLSPSQSRNLVRRWLGRIPQPLGSAALS